jgi:integrase
MEARERALGGEWARPKIGERKTVAGTVNAALIGYYASSAFAALGESTRNNRRRILENFRTAHGDKRMALMSSDALQIVVDTKTPASQKDFRKAMSGFIKHARAMKLIGHDPLTGVAFAKLKQGPGHLPWTSEECEQFEAAHSVGTKARLAYELLLQLGHSKCDVVRVGPQHIKNGVLSFHRKKTKVDFHIPLLPPLKAAIDAMPKNERHLTFLVTEYGKPFTANGFGNWFRDRCNEAKLPRKDAETGRPRCTPHGLRKSAATRFADRGATVPQLMAWFGWKTPAEAIHYVEAADRRKAAKAAADKLRERKRTTKVSNPKPGLTK